MRPVLLVRMVEQQRATQRVAIVENNRAARVLELGHRRVRNGAAVHAAGLPHQRADRVEVVNRVIEDLETRRALEKFPELPRLLYDEAHFDVYDIAELAAPQQIAKRQHIRAETKLEIHRRDKAALAADVDDRARRGEILAHRFLNQDRRAARQLAQHADNLVAWNGKIEDRIRCGRRLGQRREHGLHAEACGGLTRCFRVDIEDARNRELEALIHGKVRRPYNAARPDDGDRAWPRRHRPCLSEMRHRPMFRTCATDRRRGQWRVPPARDERPVP